MTTRTMSASQRARTDRIATSIVRVIDAVMIYAATWHFLGWWGVALAAGLYGVLNRLTKD